MYNTAEYQRKQKSGRPTGTGQLGRQFGGGNGQRQLGGRFGGLWSSMRTLGRAAATGSGRRNLARAAKAASKTSKAGAKVGKKSTKKLKGKKPKRLKKSSKSSRKKKKSKPGRRAIEQSGNYPLLPVGSRALVPYQSTSMATGRVAGKTYPLVPVGGKKGVQFASPPKKSRLMRNPFKRKQKPGAAKKAAKEKKKKTRWQRIRNRVAAAALTGAVTGGAELGIHYGVHKLSGGATPTKSEVKEGMASAGVGVADRAMKGELTGKAVKEETTKAFKKTLERANQRARQAAGAKKGRGRRNTMRLTPKRANEILQQMRTVHAYLKAAKEKRKKRYGVTHHRVHGARAFGSGMGGKKKKKRGKKTSRGGKKKSGRGGRKKTMNIPAATRRYYNIRDVFD